MEAIFFIGLALLATAQAGASSAVQPPDPSELGLAMSTAVDSSKRKVLTFRDVKAGARLEVTFSLTGEIECMERLTAGGALIERREMHSGILSHEVFLPIRSRRVVRNLEIGRQEVEFTTWTGGKPEIVRRVVDRYEALKCAPPQPPAKWQSLLANLDWLDMRPDKPAGNAVSLGNNFEAVGCSSYPSGGNDQLARDLTRGLREGLQCMAKMGGQRRMDAAAMLAFMQPGYGRRARIICGTPGTQTGSGHAIEADERAMAHDCTDSTFPAMQVNVTAFGPPGSEAERRSTLVHEMLHWIGYRHYEGVDVTYLVELCCMNDGPADSVAGYEKKIACDILDSGADWKSLAYLEKFAVLMRLNGRSTVAIKTGWEAFLESPRLPPPDQMKRNSEGLYFTMMRLVAVDESKVSPAKWREEGLPLLAMILGRAAVENASTKFSGRVNEHFDVQLRNRYYPASDPKLAPKREFADMFGKLIGDVSRGDVQKIKENWPKLREAKSRVCPLMTAHEKAQIQQAGKTTALHMAKTMNQNLDSELLSSWTNLCP